MTPEIARKAFVRYFAISLGVALLFLAGTFLTGQDYLPAERYGGAGWVMFLALLVTMPLVIPRVQQQGARDHEPGNPGN